MLPLALLTGCARSVSVVHSPSHDDGDGATTVDSGGHSGGWAGDPPPPGLGVATVSHQPCDDQPSTGKPDEIALSYCERLSPEPEQSWPGGAGFRCGVFNVTGEFALDAADPANPAILYCDGDPDGGMRFGTVDAAKGELTSTIVREGCSGWQGDGAMARVDDRRLVAWPEIEVKSPSEVYDRPTLGWLDGYLMTGEPWVLDETVEVMQLGLTGDGDLATLIDQDGVLWARPLGAEGAKVRITDSLKAQGLADGAPGEALVATCELREVVVYGLDVASGAVSWTRGVRGSDCEEWLGVGIDALPDGTFAVGWASDSGGVHAAVYGSDHEYSRTYDLGDPDNAMLGVRVAAGETTFLVAGGGVPVVVLDAQGQLVASFHHAALMNEASALIDLRLGWNDHDATFAPVWRDAVNLGPHVYTYDIVELSGARLLE